MYTALQGKRIDVVVRSTMMTMQTVCGSLDTGQRREYGPP